MAAPTSAPPPPLPDQTRLVCEQLVYTWAEKTLTTHYAGLGVVARSPGWPAEFYQGFCDYVPSSKLKLLDSGEVSAPVGLARYATEHGTLVVSRRAYPRGHQRPGNYIVHALLDPTGALGAREALALYGSTQLVSTWDPDASQELPQLVVRAEPPLEHPLAAEQLRLLLPVLLEAALRHFRTGERAALQLGSEGDGVAWLRHVAAALPARLAADLTFSTYEPSPAAASAALMLHRPELQAGQLPASVRVITAASATAWRDDTDDERLALELAEEHLAGRPLSALVDAVADMRALHGALSHERLAATPFADLTVSDLEALGTVDEEWLAAHLDESLARLHTDPLPATLLDALAAIISALPDEERATTVAELLGDECAAHLRRQDGYIWPLLDRLGVDPARVPEEALRVATDRLHHGALHGEDLGRGIELLLTHHAVLSREEQLYWLAAGTVPVLVARELPWGSLHEAILRQYVTLPSPDPRLREAVAQMVPQFGNSVLKEVNLLLLHAGVDARDLAGRLVDAAPQEGPELLLRSQMPAYVLREEVLASVPDEQQRLELARESWPRWADDWPLEVRMLVVPVTQLPRRPRPHPEPEPSGRVRGLLPRRHRNNQDRQAQD
jgi:hypothetical protein